MPYTDAGKNKMLDALVADITHAVAYDGDPTDTGTELDRQAVTFGSAASGSVSSTNQPAFDIAQGETVAFVGFIDGDDADALLAYHDVTDEAFSNAGTYTLTDADFDLNAA